MLHQPLDRESPPDDGVGAVGVQSGSVATLGHLPAEDERRRFPQSLPREQVAVQVGDEVAVATLVHAGQIADRPARTHEAILLAQLGEVRLEQRFPNELAQCGQVFF